VIVGPRDLHEAIFSVDVDGDRRPPIRVVNPRRQSAPQAILSPRWRPSERFPFHDTPLFCAVECDNDRG
jgi:hypothetical protein